MSDTEYREGMSERGIRPQSSVDGALMEVNKGLENMGQSITHLENRLSAVMHDPRSTEAGGMKDYSREEPSGESSLLVRLHTLSAELRNQTDRIEALDGRLDI